MTTAQSGILSLGTNSQAYLEFDLRAGADPTALVRTVANLREPRTTMAGVNLVAGFRPELWRGVQPRGIPPDVVGFNRDLTGADGFVMPATQRDAVVWLSGPAYDVVFDEARTVVQGLAAVASVAEETSGWPYRRDRDLTGFIDGTENPGLFEVPSVALIPPGTAGSGGSILLLQKWVHDARAWESLSTDAQERAIGRRKADSKELDPRPADSHVARTDQDRFGKIFRRNLPYGTVSDHGTMFVGFSADQGRLSSMLESMAGVKDGVRDELTRYTHPLTGAYYFVPSADAIRAFADRA